MTTTEVPENQTPVILPDWTKVLFQKWWQRAYLYGGRKGSKTESIARYILLRMIEEPLNVLCVREVQNSIEDSVHGTFKAIIEEYGWADWFEVTKNEIKTPIGGRVIYAGLYNSRGSIRSKARINLTWVEEAAYVSRTSIEELEPSVDRVPGSQIIYTFNTLSPNTPVYEDAMLAERTRDPEVYVKKINYNDHGLLPEKTLRGVVKEKILKPERFAHKYLGQPITMTEGLVFHKGKHWRFGNLDDKIRHLEPIYAMDFGKTTNATAAGKVYKFDRTIYVHTCIHGYEIKSFELPAFLCGTDRTINDLPETNPRWHNPRPAEWRGIVHPSEAGAVTVWCDHDTPNIRELNDAGIVHAQIVPFKNKKDSEWQSVEWAKDYDIVVHPTRCPLLVAELPLYSYEPNKAVPGEFNWKKFLAGNDNAVDACLRYPFFNEIFSAEPDDGGYNAFGLDDIDMP